MGKLTKEDKVIRAKRLNKLIEEVGISKKEFADLIGRSAVLVSNMTNTRNPATVSDKTIEEVHAHFPKYSIGWLKGEEPYPNETARIRAEWVKGQKEEKLLELAFTALFEAAGYTHTLTMKGKTNDYNSLIDGGITISNGKSSVVISTYDYMNLRDEVTDFMRFKLERLFK